MRSTNRKGVSKLAGVGVSARVRGLAIFAAIMIAGTATYVATRDGHTVSVTAIWLPSPRTHDGVAIFATVAGSAKVDKVVAAAPFHRSFSAKSGDKVVIVARLIGNQPATILGCSVVIDGLEEMNRSITPTGNLRHIECFGVVP